LFVKAYIKISNKRVTIFFSYLTLSGRLPDAAIQSESVAAPAEPVGIRPSARHYPQRTLLGSQTGSRMQVLQEQWRAHQAVPHVIIYLTNHKPIHFVFK